MPVPQRSAKAQVDHSLWLIERLLTRLDGVVAVIPLLEVTAKEYSELVAFLIMKTMLLASQSYVSRGALRRDMTTQFSELVTASLRLLEQYLGAGGGIVGRENAVLNVQAASREISLASTRCLYTGKHKCCFCIPDQPPTWMDFGRPLNP